MSRNGFISNETDGLSVFVDTDMYGEDVVNALRNGGFEYYERGLAKRLFARGDRVLEAGTGLGTVTMTTARIVGAQNVCTFEGNPGAYRDAMANFQRNGLDQISAFNAILKNRKHFAQNSGPVEFGVSNRVDASRITGFGGKDIVDRVEVSSICFEDQIEARDINGLIVDIEGGEIDLLMDASIPSIDKMILELHPSLTGQADATGLINKLISDGLIVDDNLSDDQFKLLRRI